MLSNKNQYIDFKYKYSYDIERMKRVNATDFKFE